MTLKRPRGVCLIIANRFQLKCQVKKARNLSKRHFWLITLTTITINSSGHEGAANDGAFLPELLLLLLDI